MTSPSTSPFRELASRAELPAAHVLAALQDELANDAAPRRARSLSTRVSFSVFALLLGVSVSALSQLQRRPETVVLAAAALGVGATVLLLAGAIPTGRSGMGVFTRRALVALLTAVLFSTLALQADHFLGLSEMETQHYHRAIACHVHALVTGMAASCALLFLWRRSDPFSPGVTGAFLGFVGGAVGTLSVGLICSNHEGVHLTVGHGLSTLVLTILGAYAGRKWLTP